jgi:signal transduction histidine kinase
MCRFGGLGVVLLVSARLQSADWSVTRWGAEQGLPSVHVSALVQTSDQFLWVGTPAGLSRFDGQRFVHLGRDQFAGAPATFAPLALAGSGGTNFWVASAEGVYRRTEQGFVRLEFNNPDEAAPIRSLTHRQAGGREARFASPVWVGTDRGVHEIYKGALKPVWKNRTDSALQLAESAVGLGVATADAVWLYRPDASWLPLATVTNATPSCPPALTATTGVLWFAGPAGAGQQVGHQTPKFVPLRSVGPGCYRLVAGSPNGVRWLVEADLGLLRRDTNGIAQIPGTARTDIGPITALTLDSLDRVWLGTTNGLLCVQPARQIASEPPSVQLDTIQWAGAELSLAPAGNQLLCQPAKTAGEISVRFAAPLRLPGDGVRFAHRLTGQGDDAWHETEVPAASYQGLGPGQYIFEVRAQSARGAWSPSRTLVFELEPGFLGSSAFRVLLAILGSGALAASAWWRLRWRQRHPSRRQNALLSTERERIARDLHDDIGSQLTALALQAELLLRRADPAIAGELEKIANQARGAAGRMSEIVWELNPACDTVASFGNFLAAHTEQWAQLTGTAFKVEIPPELPVEPMSPSARRHLSLVIQEALANVAKHAGATEAKLVVRYGPDQLFLSVQDNGKGFDPAETEATPVGHSRNGIRNQRSRVAELGGTIELRSRFGGGTRLDVTVPLEALSRDEKSAG